MVLDRLQEEGVTLNRDKCIFRANKLEYLGHVIGEGGVRKDPRKVQAIKEFAPPENTKALRRFLGMVNQLAR